MRFQTKPLTGIITLVLLVCFGLAVSLPLGAVTEEDKEDASRMWREIEKNLSLSNHNLYNGRTILKYRDKIELTPAQVTRIENLMMEFEAFYISKSGEIKSRELRFAFYLRSGEKEPDRKEMAGYIREISDIKTEVIVKHVNYLLDLKEVITPRQLKMLATLEGGGS